MAIITVSGSIGKIIFVPGNAAENKEAVLNVGVLERSFKNGHPYRKWYQACWKGKEAEDKKNIMARVKGVSVVGDEDFRIKPNSESPELERVIWVIRDTVHWKEKDQIEMKL
jgi:hypothetical protein